MSDPPRPTAQDKPPDKPPHGGPAALQQVIVGLNATINEYDTAVAAAVSILGPVVDEMTVLGQEAEVHPEFELGRAGGRPGPGPGPAHHRGLRDPAPGRRAHRDAGLSRTMGPGAPRPGPERKGRPP